MEDESNRRAADIDALSSYHDLRTVPLNELSGVLVACGVDESWVFKHVGAMREVLRYHVKDADGTWSLATIDQELRSDDNDLEHYGDRLLDDMGFDELDKVCRSIAEWREWDYEPEQATDLLPPWETTPKPVVTVEACDDDVEVDTLNELPF